jgi:ribosomal subunit interface protein
MTIEFTGRKTEVPEALRRLGARKLARIARLLPGLTRAHVVLKADRRRQAAEVSVHSRHLELTAQEAGPDLGLSLAAAFEKLERQARDYVGKRIDRRRRSAASAVRPARPAGPAPSRRAGRRPRLGAGRA